MANATATDVQKAYLAYFGRPADPVGLAYWTGKDVATMKAGFAASAEYTALYAGMSTTQMVAQVYQNLLGREAELAGLLYWSGEMTAGRQTVTTLVDAIQTNALGNDVTTINNRVTYANAFTAALDTTAEVIGYSGNTAAAAARTAVSTVLDTAASLTAAQTALPTSVATVVAGGASSSGSTFTLTTGMESVVGGSGADSIYGVVSAASTLNPYDVISGGSGTDTLYLTLNGANYAGDSTISGVEVLDLRASTAVTFNANAMTGLTSIVSDGSVNTLGVTNIGSTTAAIGMKNVATAAAVMTATFADAALTGTSDTVTVNLNAAGNAANAPGILVNTTGSANGAENLAVATSTTASVLGTLLSESNVGGTSVLKKVTVTGDQDLTVNTALDFAGTTGAVVDASAFTGKLSVGIDVNQAASVTGGTGNDTFAFTTGLTVDDTVNGGNGTDTVSVTNMDTFTLANYTKLTNVEILDQQSTNNADLSLVTAGAALTKVVLRENATTNKAISAADLAAGVAVDLVQTTDGQLVGATTLGLKDASGTADALTVTLKGVAAHGAADNAVASLTVANLETLNLVSSSTSTTGGVLAAADANTLTTITADTALATINASGSSALIASVGAAATKLTKFDGSAMTADLAVTLAAGDVSLSGGSGDDTFTFAATLNNKDTVVGGANSLSTTEDLLTATVTGLTATTGALNVSGVERLNLTNAGTAVIDATKVTGASEIAIVENAGAVSTTISGLAAGATVGLGFKGTATAATVLGTVVLSMADETGTADAVTLNLNDTTDGDTNTVTLKTTAIETVNLKYSTTAAALASTTVTSTDLKASTVNVSGSDGDADNVVTLGTLNAATTTVDASNFKGKLVVSAASGTAATTISANGLVANNITGSGKNDTVTIGAVTAAQVNTVAGGAGTDTLNITLKDGNQDFTSISAFETINITVADSAAVAMTNVAGITDANLATLTITGGNTLSTFTNTAAAAAVTTALTKIDTSGFKGAASLFFADDALTSANVITGGAATNDLVNVIISNSANTYKMSAVETLSVKNSGGASSIDLTNVTGLTNLIVNDAATGSGTITLTGYDTANTKLTLGVGVDGVAGTDVDNVQITVTGANVTGAADTLNVTVQNVNATATLSANGIETLNLAIASDAGAAQALNVTDTNATNKFVTNVTGGTSGVAFTLNSLSSDATQVIASSFIGDLTLTAAARAGTTAMTLTGGTGTDALNMKHANDVVDGGTGTDTLSIVANMILGGTAIDLSSTVDQVTTYNGSANSAAQKGFENVNLSGVTGVFGADVTAVSTGSTITGTSNNDVITGGAGTDNITGGAGNDSISLSSGGTDTVVHAGNATDGVDVVTGFTGGAAGDAIDFNSALVTGTAGQGKDTTGNAVTYAASAVETVAADTAAVTNSTAAIWKVAEALTAGTDASNATSRAVTELADGAADFSANFSAGEGGLIIMNDTVNAFLFEYKAAGTAAQTETGEVTLIGIFSLDLYTNAHTDNFA